MRVVLRAGVITLAAIQVVLGVWTAFFPASFYHDVPTVDWTPPYSEHLFRDFGGATLGIAVVVIAAAIWFERRMVVLAMLAYLLFSGPHLVFHAHHLRTDSPLAVALVVVLSLSVLLPLLVIVGARDLDRPRRLTMP